MRVSSRYCSSSRGINCLSRRYIAIKIVDLIAELPISGRSFACVIIASDISDVCDAKVTSLVAIGHLWHTIETFLRERRAREESSWRRKIGLKTSGASGHEMNFAENCTSTNQREIALKSF